MRRIGKRGRANITANRKCKAELLSKGITRCGVCGTDNYLTIAHIRKRREMTPDELSEWGNYLLLCQRCHEHIEYDKDKTIELFRRLR